jgi:hypothetical protein
MVIIRLLDQSGPVLVKKDLLVINKIGMKSLRNVPMVRKEAKLINGESQKFVKMESEPWISLKIGKGSSVEDVDEVNIEIHKTNVYFVMKVIIKILITITWNLTKFKHAKNADLGIMHQ